MKLPVDFEGLVGPIKWILWRDEALNTKCPDVLSTNIGNYICYNKLPTVKFTVFHENKEFFEQFRGTFRD